MTKKIGILGSGFGLYGYMPAILSSGHTPVTLERYKRVITERQDLSCYLDRILFVEAETDLRQDLSALVIARDPTRQYDFLNSNRDNLRDFGHLFLEKPLTASVATHHETVRLLEESQARFSVAYLFRIMPWYAKTLDLISSGRSIKIDWLFSTVEKGWKLESDFGGGLFNFVGTHFAELLYSLNQDLARVSFSKVRSEQDNFRIQSENMTISVRKENFNSFKVSTDQFTVFESASPLGERAEPNKLDPRLPIISHYLQSALEHTSRWHSLSVEKYSAEFRELFENNILIRGD